MKLPELPEGWEWLPEPKRPYWWLKNTKLNRHVFCVDHDNKSSWQIESGRIGHCLFNVPFEPAFQGYATLEEAMQAAAILVFVRGYEFEAEIQRKEPR